MTTSRGRCSGSGLRRGSRLRFRSRCHSLNSGFHLGLRGLQLFQMEFELFELNNDLLALDAEHPALQLLDDQLQMLDLLAAGAQLLILLGECLAMGLKLSLKRAKLVFASGNEIEAPLDAHEQCQQASRSSGSRSGNGAESMDAVCHRSNQNAPQNVHENRGICAGQSDCDLRRPGPLRPAPIDAFEQHRKLRTRQTHGSFRSLRPDESASLQTLGKQAQAVAIEPEKLDHVASAPAKDKDMAGERLLLQHRLHLRTQAIETTPHIRHAGGNPDLRSRAKLDHLRKLSRIERNNEPIGTALDADHCPARKLDMNRACSATLLSHTRFSAARWPSRSESTTSPEAMP